jgi:hypothetical protein
VPQRTWRKPLWVKPELLVRARHLAGGDTLRHAIFVPAQLKQCCAARLGYRATCSRPVFTAAAAK